MDSREIEVRVKVPVEVHDDGDGQWVARVPGQNDIVGMGGSADEARKQLRERASELLASSLKERDLNSSDRSQGTGAVGNPEQTADRAAASVMGILRNRNTADAQTHAAIRSAFVAVLAEQRS